ncbi:peroxiredoxin [Simiduia aestuariiviva]|uniref:Glutathione-dependent peroxiredoxin n=1 Tax=Simiduia aestuariiviva TaxID=1510459 RepID=A0A839USH3_9GAMM|nr:peroxiredoxin [Simiduia aestuariiviva]MBB3169399.1 peroxiredoxin [Simiduia aestuariiviva]
MTIQQGDQLPDAELRMMGTEGMQTVSAQAFLGQGRVALFAVPGAFTPTCSKAHLPGFVVLSDKLKAAGVDKIACVSVNDAFVMDAWGKSANADGVIHMLADGNGDFTRALGLELDARGGGMGMRSQRYSMLLEDGRIALLNVEAPKAFEVSTAEYMLNQLQQR